MSTNDENTNKLAQSKRSRALTKPLTSTVLQTSRLPSELLKDKAIDRLILEFESKVLIDELGVEFWYARELQTLLGYERWDKFCNVIDKAKISCKSTGYFVSDHFSHVGKMVEIGSGVEREIEDIKLTRYACYLTAQNADSRKKPVAFAQTYFAIQTRKQEIREQDEVNALPLTEAQKRLWLREEIKQHNRKLASAAKDAGVIEPVDFAIFTNFGYKGMYGGLDRAGIAKKKGIKSKEKLLDHMDSTELAANLFRATQTEEKLKREEIKGKINANQAHFEVGKKVRQTIKEIGGTMPEDLPPVEDIVKLGRRLQKALKDSQK